MKARSLLVSLACLALLNACNFKHKEADLVVHNALIYTVDEGFSIAQAMAIKDGKIIALGKEREILNNFRYKEALDAKKQFIYPGFIDAHCHFLGYGLSLQNVNLIGTKSFSEVLTRLHAFKEFTKSEGWIVGRGWDHTDWPGKAWPTKDSLDYLFPNTPILLQRIDGHAALANQAALNLAGFSASTQIEGGIIELKNGQLTGLLKENAVDSLAKFIPKNDESKLRKALQDAEKKCFAVGLTTVDDAGLNLSDILLIQKMHTEKALSMQIYAMASDNEDNFRYFMKNGPLKTPQLNVCSFKFYADGSLGSRSACMLEVYSDAERERGIMTIPYPELRKKVALLKAKGFQANTHCIGDSANRAVLQIYAEALGGSNDLRWRIEHAQVVNPEDLRYFKDFNIIPSVQSTHATSDMKWAEARLGTQRIHHAYAYSSLFKQNGLLALGTDFPVEDIDPLKTFYAAVFRLLPTNTNAKAFLPNEALSAQEALKAMTIWAAISNFEEAQKGSLEIGKQADFVLLNQDLLKVNAKNAAKTTVTATYLAGKLVYQK